LMKYYLNLVHKLTLEYVMFIPENINQIKKLTNFVLLLIIDSTSTTTSVGSTHGLG